MCGGADVLLNVPKVEIHETRCTRMTGGKRRNQRSTSPPVVAMTKFRRRRCLIESRAGGEVWRTVIDRGYADSLGQCPVVPTRCPDPAFRAARPTSQFGRRRCRTGERRISSITRTKSVSSTRRSSPQAGRDSLTLGSNPVGYQTFDAPVSPVPPDATVRQPLRRRPGRATMMAATPAISRMAANRRSLPRCFTSHLKVHRPARPRLQSS